MLESRLRGWCVSALLVGVAACGSDKSATGNGLTCGEGTELVQGQCVPRCRLGAVLRAGECVPDGSNGAAGSGGDSGSENGGSESDAGHAGSSDADAGQAGTEDADGGSAGSEPSTSGSGGTSQSVGGGAGTGPSGGSAGRSGNSGEGGGGGVGPVAPHWLAFTHSDGAFAYDVTKFPGTTGLAALHTGGVRSVGPWSPDGRWLLYWVGGDLYCRDMKASVPGPPLVLMTGVVANPTKTFQTLSWSADSKTVAVATPAPGSTTSQPLALLQVLDPTRAAPPLQTLSSSVSFAAWAPAGDRILFREGGVNHVRRVQAGVPGTDLQVNGLWRAWSPDGTNVAAESNGNLTLTDVTQATPTPVVVSSPTIAAPNVTAAVFSQDGALLVYRGEQARNDAQDLFRVLLKPTISAAALISTGLTGTSRIITFSLSPDARSVVYPVITANQSDTYWAVSLSAAQPGAPFQILAPPSNDSAWLPSNFKKFLGAVNGNLSLFDLSTVGTSPITIADGNPTAAPNPLSAVAAYGSGAHLYLRDLDHLENAPGDVSFSGSPGLAGWQWSPDGKFISLVDQSNPKAQARLIRVDGITPSAAVALHGASNSAPSFAWQP